MRFIHTADWQIGKVFKQFGSKEETLRQARLAAIERLGALARAHGASHVLVAGDIYDNEAPNNITLRAPIERMNPFTEICWHLLPGNHDPHRPEGLWDRVVHLGLPPHILVHLKQEPVPLSESAVLLPSPLLRKNEYHDMTEWMDSAETPPGALRIGLAHGAVVNFASEGEAANPIDPTRPAKAGLDYLALGDWHRTCQIAPAVWYAGTPEPDRAGGQERGTALLVDLQGRGSTPSVTPLSTGTYRWLTRAEKLIDGSELADIDQRIRAEQDLSHLILRLRLEGILPLATHAELQRRLENLEAAVFHLDADQTNIVVRPTQTDLESIDFDGVLRRSADRLKALADDVGQVPELRRRAEEALVELYIRTVARSRGAAGC
jgi:DNA repair exonuclease SbcCD nuclease subunit